MIYERPPGAGPAKWLTYRSVWLCLVGRARPVLARCGRNNTKHLGAVVDNAERGPSDRRVVARPASKALANARFQSPMRVVMALAVGTLFVAGCSATAGNSTNSSAASVPASDRVTSSSGAMSPEQFCAASNELFEAGMQNLPSDPREVQRRSAVGWSKLATIAPPDIRPDIQKIAEVEQQKADGIIDSSSALTEPASSAKNFADWMRKHCAA